MSIEIRSVWKERSLNMQGGVVLDGLPSIGMVNAIASECLIRTRGTELYAVLDSPEFPCVSIISDGQPQFPVRLYVNEALKVAFFISEINIEPQMQNTFGKLILNWSVQNKCRMVVSGAGISGSEQADSDAAGNDSSTAEQKVYAVTSTDSATKIANDNGFVQLKTGLMGGIPASLLNEGAIAGMDVMILVVSTIQGVPDFRASSLISNAVTKLVPGLTCDTATLIDEAQLIENKMKLVRDRHREYMSMYK